MNRQASRIAKGVTAVTLLGWALIGCGFKQTPGAASQPTSRKASATSRADQQEAQPPSGKTTRSSSTLLAAAEGPKTAGAASESAPRGAAAALKRAQDQKKHAFLLFYKQGDEACAKMRKTLDAAEKTLRKRAVFYAADVAAEKDKETVAKYQADKAPLPLTLVFAPNGALERTHVGKAVNAKALANSFSSAKLAEVQKHLQDRKLVLLCAQNDHTKHNSESRRAAEAAIKAPRAGGQIVLVNVDPRDGDSADLLKQVKLDSSLKEASICILIPPSTLGKTVQGATTKDALWEAITSSASACSTGCGPSGCG